MTTLEQVKAWNWLMGQVAKVPDYNVRVALKEEYRRKALKVWGWVPGDKAVAEQPPELDAWEKAFVEDTQDVVEFGVDVRKEKRSEELKNARANMVRFVNEGGTLLDIPANLRSQELVDLFYSVLAEYGDEIVSQIDNVTKKAEND